MWFDEQNKLFLASTEPINDATGYDVRVVPAEVEPGETYWRIIGVHHLTGEENRGGHNLYIGVLDENGQRVSGGWAGWTWLGRKAWERADPAQLDKPPTEPAGNITMHGGQVVSAWILGLSRDAKDNSDLIENVHTSWPDEPPGNTIGHHSFYVVFQRTTAPDEEPPPTEPPPTEPPPEPPPPTAKLIDHYVLLSEDIGWATYILISRWLAEEKITAGFVVSEALLARRITGIGDFDDETKKVLLDSDSEFTLLSGKCALADEIKWMLRSNRAARAAT